MAILTVGYGLQFKTIKDAVAASHNGDTIYVQAGTYTNDFADIYTNISIVGVGGMVHLDATKIPTSDKGIFVTNANVKLDHLEFSGAKSSSANGAGVKYQQGSLTITNSYFHDNENGLLTSAYTGGVVTIDHSEFAHNGAGDGQTHNIYVGLIDTFTITNSYTHDAVEGHEIKSRALHTTVTGNRIVDGNSTASYSVDLPAAGITDIENNFIQQGPNSQNTKIIRYAEEPFFKWASQALVVRGNTIVNQLAGGAIGVENDSPTMTAQITGNHFYGLTAAQIALGSNVQSGNDSLAALPAIDTSHPWAASPWDKIVWGGAASNVLYGSSARDLFAAASGNDTFVIQSGGNSDTIANFQGGAGVGDVVRLEGYSFSDFNTVKAAMSQHGSDVWLNLGHGETLTFQNMTVSAFAANDFQFSAQLNVASVNAFSPTVLNRPAPFTLPFCATYTNQVIGNSGSNNLVGTSQSDKIDGGGGSGIDTMQGGLGDDRYVVYHSSDVVIENAGGGIDMVAVYYAPSYTLAANVENLQLGDGATAHNVSGNVLNNLIVASNANDTINGGGGNDIINAGTGADVLTGGAGNDMFVFRWPVQVQQSEPGRVVIASQVVGAASTITDFHVGEDLLDLRPMMQNAGYRGSDPLGDHVMAVTSDGHGGSMITVDPTHSGTMHNLVDLQGITADMIFVGYDILF